MSQWKRIMNEDTHSATQMEHDQSSYFCRGPAPVGPTLVTGLKSPSSLPSFSASHLPPPLSLRLLPTVSHALSHSPVPSHSPYTQWRIHKTVLRGGRGGLGCRRYQS